MNVIKESNFISDTFLKLTSKTYPYGYEDGLMEDMIKLGLFTDKIQKDKHGNFFYNIGESRTIFASHLDTACKDQVYVNHVIDGSTIKTDGKSILGADDKAGVTIMLWMMIHNIPGLYYFFIGEEVGCIGSGLASKYGDFKGKYDRIISFDRRGLDSVITYQSGSRCCSDEFAQQLANELNVSGMVYKKDNGGIYTDSAEFVSVIPECTNLSVGYYKEHTTGENQDIEHLELLSRACLLVNWENLITKRDPSKTELKSYGWGDYSVMNASQSSYDWRDRDGGYKPRRKRTKRNRNVYGYNDDWYEEFDKTPSKKASKRYYDGGDGELIDITPFDKNTSNKTGDSYDWLIEKMTDSSMSHSDLDIIQEQYLDMDDRYDRLFYNYLLGQVIGGYQ